MIVLMLFIIAVKLRALSEDFVKKEKEKRSIENIFLMSRYSKLVDYGKNKVQQLVTH